MARVNDVPITVAEVAKRVRDKGSTAVRRLSNPKRMRQFVEDQVRFELLVQASLERGLHQDPDVIEAARKVMVRKLLQRDMGDSVFPEVSDAAISNYYAKHEDEYVQAEKRRYAEIQLAPTEEGRVLAQTLTDRLLKRPNERSLFRSLSLKHSPKKQPKTIGMTDLFKSRNTVVENYGQTFAAEVFSAKPNTVIPHPVQSTRGWHVVRLHAVRDALTRGLDEVREEIRDRLRRGARSKVFESYLTGLKRRHPVVIYEGRIASVIDAISAKPRDPSNVRAMP